MQWYQNEFVYTIVILNFSLGNGQQLSRVTFDKPRLISFGEYYQINHFNMLLALIFPGN